MQTYTVIYRTGGTENFKWNRVGERYPDRSSAQKSADGLERMGYPSLVHDTKLLDAIGLPETFNANAHIVTVEAIKRVTSPAQDEWLRWPDGLQNY